MSTVIDRVTHLPGGLAARRRLLALLFAAATVGARLICRGEREREAAR